MEEYDDYEQPLINDSTDESFLSRLSGVVSFISPFMLSRLALAITWFCNSIVLAKLGEDELAAGPFIATFAYAVLGTTRSILLATGIMVGNKNSIEDYKNCGSITINSWIYAIILLIPTMSILANAKNILLASNVNENVATLTQDYFYYFLIGTPAIAWLTPEQQFALGIKRPNIALVVGSAFAIGTMGIGYPLALLTPLKIKGLAIGISISAWLTLISLRIFYRKREFEKYGLFVKPKLSNAWVNIKEFFKLGLPLGLQNFCEWGNLFLVSLIIGSISTSDLKIEQISTAFLSTVYLIFFSVAQAGGVLVSNQLGGRPNSDISEEQENKAKSLGNLIIIFGTVLSLFVSVIMFSFPQGITDVLGRGASVMNDKSVTYLRINAIGLALDGIRITCAGVLRGKKDVCYSPTINLLCMTFCGWSLGTTLTKGFDYNTTWLFITRDIGILFAAILNLKRWFSSKIDHSQDESSQTRNGSLFSCCYGQRV